MSYQKSSHPHVATPEKFGRYSVAEPLRPETMHVYRGTPLKEVSWPIPIPVLDQEDLIAQGIDTSKLIPGAQKVNALGSCTANASTAHLAERFGAAGRAIPFAGRTAVGAEKFAITFYHRCTDQTGDPSQEWPPTDCGSTGLYCCHEMERLGFIRSFKTAPTAFGLLSLLQSGSVIQGTPWFYSWMQPTTDGFVDGDGSIRDLDEAIASGVAGGHETCVHAIEHLALSKDGAVNLSETVLRVRNSWSAAYALQGDFRIHASTLDFLGQYVDFKQFVL